MNITLKKRILIVSLMTFISLIKIGVVYHDSQGSRPSDRLEIFDKDLNFESVPAYSKNSFFENIEFPVYSRIFVVFKPNIVSIVQSYSVLAARYDLSIYMKDIQMQV